MIGLLQRCFYVFVKEVLLKIGIIEEMWTTWGNAPNVVPQLFSLPAKLD